jgi:hypothetical protein
MLCNIIYLIPKLINNLDLPSLLGDQRIAAGLDAVYQAESRPYRHNQVQTHVHLYASKREPSSRRRRWPRRLSIPGRQILIGRLEAREKSLSWSLFIYCSYTVYASSFPRAHTRTVPRMSLSIYCLCILLRAHEKRTQKKLNYTLLLGRKFLKNS